MNIMSKNILGLSLLLSAALLTPAVAGEPASTKTNAFFAFCIDTHDAKKRNQPRPNPDAVTLPTSSDDEIFAATTPNQAD